MWGVDVKSEFYLYLKGRFFANSSLFLFRCSLSGQELADEKRQRKLLH